MHPRNVVQEGEAVRVRIIHIDAEDRRLGLSLRNVPQPEAVGESEQEPQAPEIFESP
jgi:ribosomal protein S1